MPLAGGLIFASWVFFNTAFILAGAPMWGIAMGNLLLFGALALAAGIVALDMRSEHNEY
jgi:hypothetical protein